MNLALNLLSTLAFSPSLCLSFYDYLYLRCLDGTPVRQLCTWNVRATIARLLITGHETVTSVNDILAPKCKGTHYRSFSPRTAADGDRATTGVNLLSTFQLDPSVKRFNLTWPPLLQPRSAASAIVNHSTTHQKFASDFTEVANRPLCMLIRER